MSTVSTQMHHMLCSVSARLWSDQDLKMYQHWLWTTFQSTWLLLMKKRANMSQVINKTTINSIRIRIKSWPTTINSNKNNIAKVLTRLKLRRTTSKLWGQIIPLMASVKIKTTIMTKAWSTLRITTKSSNSNKPTMQIKWIRVQTAPK